MFQIFHFTHLTILLIFVLLIVIVLIIFISKNIEDNCEDDFLQEPPSPKGLPIIGHLHLLSGYKVPYQAFTELKKKYGNVFKLKLGRVESVIVSGQDQIKEVLINKMQYFDNRPSFERHQQLFSGNKENSLAFCNWSSIQRTRRDLLKIYTFPKALTRNLSRLENHITKQTDYMLSHLSLETEKLKPLILKTCANIFTGYFCSKIFDYQDKKFSKMVECFDEIFFEVNQGYAADFLPFLLPFHYKTISRMNNLTHKIRRFVEENIIENRFNNFDKDEAEDLVESLIKHVKNEEEPRFGWDTALFALEDVIGGHSAVGNFFMKLLAFLVQEPDVQKNIQNELDSVTKGRSFGKLKLEDRSKCPYMEATIYEAIRLIASPIVPRVANQDTSIDDFKVKKDTLIFLNNYDLSMSNTLWDEPKKFKPERFISNGRLLKPDHFLPFGGGRRSCMGNKIVHYLTFAMLGRILQNYIIKPVENVYYNVPVGSLALSKDPYVFIFDKR